MIFKSKIILALILFSLFSQANAWPFSKKKDEVSDEKKLQQEKLIELRKEVSALQKIRISKAEELERKEASRWEERYRQNLLVEEQKEKTKSLESRYTRRASDLSRVNDELLQSKSLSNELKENYESSQQQLEGLVVQYRQAIEESASKLAQDIPLNKELRVLTLSQAGEMINLSEPKISQALNKYYSDKFFRLKMTIDQSLNSQNSIMGSTAETPVSRLTAGTIFSAEVSRNGGSSAPVQMLLKTGSLQGKTYDWVVDLNPEYQTWLRDGLNSAVAGNDVLNLPLDVLQSKALNKAASANEEVAFSQAIKKWFNTGGIVMYPLIFIALLAFILLLQKYYALSVRGRTPNNFHKKLDDLVVKENWEDARSLCQKHNTSIAFVLSSILNYASADRNSAEKSLRESMLREYPFLERRLAIIGALGSSAPLLGLLGTVSGMITLFKIITQAGTNDARILAGGISEALVTTQTGLIIAVPIMLLHGYLVEKMEKIIADNNYHSMSLLNKIWPEDIVESPSLFSDDEDRENAIGKHIDGTNDESVTPENNSEV